LGGISAAAPQYGVLSSLQGAPGTLAGDLVGNPAFGSVAAPTSYNYGFQTPDMPGFASGALVGDEPPDTLATPQQVRNFALMNMAQNFGALYGDKFGLPSTFGFSDPAFVAAIVNGAQQQESKFNPAAISPDGGIGLSQMTAGGKYAHAIGPYSGAASDPGADRASSLLGFVGTQAGVDPSNISSLDPRAVGIPAAQATLSDLQGVYNNEEAFGLAQLATNPMYARSLAAVNSPTMSPQDAEATYTRNFENPDPAKANLAAREAAAASYYGLGQQQEAALGLAGPARVGPGLSGVTSPATGGVGPAASAPSDAGTTAPASTPAGTAVPSGAPSVTDGQTAPAASTSPYGTLGGLSPSDFTNTGLPSLATNPPSYTSPDATAPADTITPPGTPQQQDGVTPNYMPGEQTGLEAFVNGVLGSVGGPFGLVNGLSALVGGPSVGGWLAKNSKPGNPANPNGTPGSHNNPVANLDATASPVAQSYTTAPSTSTYTGTNATTATQAYLDALKTLPGPTARTANPVPLVAPGRNVANFYNPLNDPTVIAALRAARLG
jgi:hypothetical protein